MSKVEDYGNDSIDQLEGCQRVRYRPAQVLGSNGLAGAKHTIDEILGNCSDEKLSGFGSKLDIKVYSDKSISIRDYGRGVPLGWNTKKNEWNWFLIYEEMYAGGKYRDKENQEKLRSIKDWSKFNLKDFNYLISVGLNGLGAAATQYTSEFFEVTSYRNGEASTMKFKKGKHVLEELIVEPTSEENGTYIRWKPDSEVFTDTNITPKWVEGLSKNQSFIAGFDVTFEDEKGTVKVFNSCSISDIMKEEVGFSADYDNFTHVTDGDGDVCICFSEVVIGPSGRGVDFFHNMVELSGGVHADAIAYALSIFFKEVGTENGLRLTSSDYSGKFSIIVSSLSNKVSYRGQTKDSLDDGYVAVTIGDCMLDLLRREHAKGSEWFKKITSSVIKAATDRLALAELSKTLKEAENSIKKTKVSEKFRSCETYKAGKAKETEVWILEGDSAGQSFKDARDSYFQCFMTIRGKSLNLYKATVDKLLQNREIKDFISMFGCGVDLGIEGYQSFDIKKLKVGKIILAADADIDGKHINILLFLIFIRLFPELLYEGYVYVAKSPLYCALLRDGSNKYLYSDDDMKEFRKSGQSFKEIIRYKGLGEVDSEVLWDSTVNPETRVLQQILINKDDYEVYDTLEVLFGKSTDRRKKAIIGSLFGDGYDEALGSMDEIIDYIKELDLVDIDYEEIEM